LRKLLSKLDRAVRDYLDGGSWQLVGEFDRSRERHHAARSELAKALAQCKRERAKLAIGPALAQRAALMDRGVDFVARDNSHANKFTCN
jgi:hypothetical protein